MKPFNYLLVISLIFLFQCIFNITINAQQDIKFRHYSAEEGLSQVTCKAILQDSKGFIWIGTTDGLNRFDGYQFKVFRHNPEDSTSLSNSFITSLLEDQLGNLWVGTNGGGLNLYMPESQSFRHFQKTVNDSSSLSDNKVMCLLENIQGNLWIGTYGGGLNLFLPGSQRFRQFKKEEHDPTSLSHNIV
ncbi:MAG: histidine kinase, partial [Cyclobacteriaceae bacterium]|nr:histidine kinase [Cyclobacteriaceae bacterium]